MIFEGLGLTNDSNLSSASLGRSTVAAQRVAVIDDSMHGNQAGEGDAQRTNDLPTHSLGYCSGPTCYAELEHGVLDAVGNSARSDLHLLGDLFGGHALGDAEQRL